MNLLKTLIQSNINNLEHINESNVHQYITQDIQDIEDVMDYMMKIILSTDDEKLKNKLLAVNSKLGGVVGSLNAVQTIVK